MIVLGDMSIPLTDVLTMPAPAGPPRCTEMRNPQPKLGVLSLVGPVVVIYAAYRGEGDTAHSATVLGE